MYMSTCIELLPHEWLIKRLTLNSSLTSVVKCPVSVHVHRVWWCPLIGDCVLWHRLKAPAGDEQAFRSIAVCVSV